MPLHVITISGGGSTRQFGVNFGLTLGLRGITLINGYGDGGAIYNNAGTVNVAGCTISGNFGGNGLGGAIFNNGGAVNVANSTFSNNTAGSGGAIANFGGAVNVANSTFSGNSATVQYGGAIDIGLNGAVNVVGSTFSGNTANSGFGGAIANGGILRLALSVAVGNAAPVGPDIYGPVTDGGGNVVNSTDTSGLNDPSDRLNVTPVFAPLGNYGGAVQTFALLPGSPAIDVAACPINPTTGAILASDARGITRPRGANCDAGAFESRGFTVSNVIGTPQVTAPGMTFSVAPGLTVSSANSEPVAGGIVTFTITAGTGGASGIFASTSNCITSFNNPTAICSVGATGTVTAPPITANTGVGTFSVTANVRGATSVTYTLTVAPVPNATPQPAPTRMVPGTPVVVPPTHIPVVVGGQNAPMPQPTRH